MRHSIRLTLLFFLLVTGFRSAAQYSYTTTNPQDTATSTPPDSTSIPCRANEFIAAANGHTLSANIMGATSYPPYAVVSCGTHFKVYYTDLLPGAPAAGFADPSSGAQRRATLCAVLQYLDSLLDFSHVPNNAPIRIVVDTSLSNLAPASTSFAAYAIPQYNSSIPGLTSGYIQQYAATGIDPIPVDSFHTEIRVNFQLSWLDDYTQPISNCQYDLYSALLHEITHSLGWFSLVEKYSSGIPIQPAYTSVHLFTRMDTTMRRIVHYPSGTPQQLIVGPYNSPTISTALNGPVIGEQNDFWLNSQMPPANLPVYSGNVAQVLAQQQSGNPYGFPNNNTFGFNAPYTDYSAGTVFNSFFSHLDDGPGVYSTRFRYSPGDVEPIVMGAFSITGATTRRITKQEREEFKRFGWNLNPAWVAANSAVNANHIPYSQRMGAYDTLYWQQQYAETMPWNYKVDNNVGTTVTINVATDPDNVDADGDSISVAPGTLVNFRGCGNGGNNHSQLSVSANGQIITYTPRPNFYGRAQFGFNLWDGKEKGSFVVYTIDVRKGNNVSVAAGSNLILNSNFEEGTETKRYGTEETLPNSMFTDGFKHESRLGGGLNQADAHPYSFTSNSAFPLTGGTYISRMALRHCLAYTGYIPTLYMPGSGTRDYDPGYTAVGPGVLDTNYGQRIIRFQNGASYQGLTTYDSKNGATIPSSTVPACYAYQVFLGDSVRHCHKYQLDFDLWTSGSNIQDSFQLDFITNNPTTANYYVPAVTNQQQTLFVNNPGQPQWTHYSFPVPYCATNASDVLRIACINGSYTYMDNVQLKEIFTPLSIAIIPTNGDTTVCSGSNDSVTLTASSLGSTCAPTYTWQPGNLSGQTIKVHPSVNTTYTVTINYACGTASASQLVVVHSTPNAPVAPNVTYCQNSSAGPLTATAASGATLNWYTGGGTLLAGAPTPQTSGVGTTTYYVSQTQDGCESAKTAIVVTVKATPPAPTPATPLYYCTGASASALTASGQPGATFNWYTVPVNGTALSSAPVPNTTAIGTFYYYVSQTVNGCEGPRATVTIVVSQSPAPPNPPTPVVYCQGATTTQLTPNGSFYQWFNTPTGGSQIAAPIPSSAVVGSHTWYVCSYNGSCQSARVAVTVTINPVPAPPTVPNSHYYFCIGSSVSPLVAAGANLQWYNSLNQPISTPTPSTATAGTTVYHVTSSSNGCTSAPAYDTVTVTPKVTMGISAGDFSPCYGTFDTLTATTTPTVTGLGFAWSATTIGGTGNASFGYLNTPINNPALTTQPNGTSVVYMVYAANGCSDTASITIKNQACSQCDLCDAELDANYLTAHSNNVSGGAYCVHNDLTISGTVTLNAAELRLSPNVSIIVPANARLNILGSWLHGCEQMWNGIVVEDGGQVVTNYSTVGHTINYTLIEDAATAISYTGTDSGNVNTIVDVQRTTFNRNNVGISLNNYNHIQATYPFSVQNSVFTCRDLSNAGSYQWAAQPDVAAANQPVNSDLETPYLDTTTYPSANLKVPMDDEQSSIGIYLGNVGKATVDTLHNTHVTQYTPHAYYGVQIGQNGGNTEMQMENYNLFDGLHNGVIGNNSSFICRNNVFQRTLNDYVWNDDDQDYDVYSGLGIGANGDQTDGHYYQMQVTALSTTDPSFSNHFFDCQTAVFNSGYSDLLISHATFRSSKTSPTMALVNTPFTGWKGIQIVNKRFFNETIDHSQFYNLHQPILFTSSANGYTNGRLNILSNCISANLNGQPVTNQYVSDAITVNHATSSTSGTNSLSQHITINNNTIQDVYRGISVNAWPGKEIAIQNNYIRMIADPVVNTQAGVNFAVNTALIQSEIQGNAIFGPATFKKTQLSGIYAYGNAKYRVSFNQSNGNYNALQFVGNNTTLKVESNKMATDHYGLVLGGAGGPGTIGVQGNLNYATDNVWQGSFTDKTALLATSTAIGNELYIRDSASLTVYNPLGYSYIANTFNRPYVFNPWHTLRWVSHPQAVAASPFHADGSECGIDEITPLPLDTGKTQVFELERTALGLNIEAGDPDSLEHLKVQQLDLIKFLNNEPEWLDSSYVLYNFYTQMVAGDAGDMSNIEEYLANEDALNADAAMDWWIPEDGIGDNYKQYYQLYLDWMEGAWTAQDAQTLTTLASGCPYKDGTAVMYARAFYTQVYGQVVIFEDNCGFDNENGTEQRHTNPNPVTAAAEPRTIQLYPNPTTGLVNITLPLEGSFSVEVTDATGKSMPVEQVNNQVGVISIRLNAAPGIYLVRITNIKSGETTVRKLTLQN